VAIGGLTANTVSVHSSVWNIDQGMSSHYPYFYEPKSTNYDTLVSGSNLLTPGSFPMTQSTSPKTDSSFEVIPGAADFESGPRNIDLPCYLIKPHVRNKEFHARDDVLQILDDALLPSSSAASEQNRENLKTFVLCGLGGIGKTQIALEFAFSRQHCYDAIFVLHADQTNKLADEFVQISTRLGLETVAEAKDPILAVKP